MTDREKAIVMAYTGACMLTGDKLSVFYEYVGSIMGRSVYTHEMAIKAVDEEIKEKSKADFIALCADESSSEKPNEWIPVSERLPEKTDFYLIQHTREYCSDEMAVAFYSVEEAHVDPNYTWEFETIADVQEVIAWMPLPEPYKASPTGAERNDKE